MTAPLHGDPLPEATVFDWLVLTGIPALMLDWTFLEVAWLLYAAALVTRHLIADD